MLQKQFKEYYFQLINEEKEESSKKLADINIVISGMNNQKKQFSEPSAEPQELENIIQTEISDFDFGEEDDEEGSLEGALVNLSFSFIDKKALPKFVYVQFATKNGVDVEINDFTIGSENISKSSLKTLSDLIEYLDELTSKE